MKNFIPDLSRLLVLSVIFSFGAGAADAACYADYKAKRDNPLRLHYGVARIDGACTKAEAGAQLAARLGQDGWQLLTVVGVFDDAGLAGRKDSAGQYFLRY
jgi:hypothetical protein